MLNCPWQIEQTYIANHLLPWSCEIKDPGFTIPFLDNCIFLFRKFPAIILSFIVRKKIKDLFFGPLYSFLFPPAPPGDCRNPLKKILNLCFLSKATRGISLHEVKHVVSLHSFYVLRINHWHLQRTNIICLKMNIQPMPPPPRTLLSGNVSCLKWKERKEKFQALDFFFRVLVSPLRFCPFKTEHYKRQKSLGGFSLSF